MAVAMGSTQRLGTWTAMQGREGEIGKEHGGCTFGSVVDKATGIACGRGEELNA